MPFSTLTVSHGSSFLKSLIHTYDAVLGLLADMGTPGDLLNTDVTQLIAGLITHLCWSGSGNILLLCTAGGTHDLRCSVKPFQ